MRELIPLHSQTFKLRLARSRVYFEFQVGPECGNIVAVVTVVVVVVYVIVVDDPRNLHLNIAYIEFVWVVVDYIHFCVKPNFCNVRLKLSCGCG